MNRFGFLKVAAAVPHVRIADCDYNAQHITELIRKGADRGASIILFPELCITSYTCGDLIQQPALLHAAEQALGYILAQTRELPIVAIVGMPVTYGNALYNCAVVFAQGRIHGVVPKTYIPNYSEFYESAASCRAKRSAWPRSGCAARIPISVATCFSTSEA